MATPKLVLTTYDGRAYTHRSLFKIAERALKRAQGNARDFDARLTATLFAALAIEAYVNLLVEQLDPVIFAKERDYFTRKNGYASLRGKIRWVLARVKAQKPDIIDAAHRRVLELIELRNTVAHTKPIAYSGSYRHPVDEEPPFMVGAWIEDRVTLPRTVRYVKAVERFCEWLNKQAAPRFADPHLRVAAFDGVTQSEAWGSAALAAALRSERRNGPARRPRLP